MDQISSNENDLFPIVRFGLWVLVIATAPIWLSALAGNKPKSCECTTKIEPYRISPSCKCYI